MNMPEQEFHRSEIAAPDGADDISTMAMRERKEDFVRIRTSIAEIFRSLGGFVHDTFSEIRSFNMMIKPYVDYFYSSAGEPGDGCFIRDVIEPNRDEMLNAVERAIDVMYGDEATYAAIAESIEKTLALKDSIDDIIKIIEEIEIYFFNALIISIKAGSAGRTLTRLSREIGSLSDTTGALSAHYTGLIESLYGEYGLFKKTCGNITILQENYLTRISMSVRNIFSEITENVRRLSRDVNGVLQDSHDIEHVMVKVLGWLQREDIFCQDVDKLVFLMELSAGNGKADFGAVFNRMFHDKTEALRGDIDGLSLEFGGFVTLIKNLATEILQRVGKKPDTVPGPDGAEGLDDIYLQVEKMRNNFIGIIEAIIEDKKRIYTLSKNICGIARRFGEFFAAVDRAIRKFEIINLLTRIEIARNSAITRSLSGSLLEISRLPGRIKNCVSGARAQYAGIMEDIENRLDVYYTTIINQESLLNGIIESIKKVSVKLYESKKYYYDITAELEKSAGGVLQFIGGEESMLARLAETVETIRCMKNGPGPYCPGNGDGRGSRGRMVSDIMELRKRFTETMADGDYRKCMLESFFNEYLDDEKDQETVFF